MNAAPLVHHAARRCGRVAARGTGNGCDAGFTGEWRDKAYAAALEARGRSAENVNASRRAKLLWGASKWIGHLGWWRRRQKAA
jgi:hypothetical protein